MTTHRLVSRAVARRFLVRRHLLAPLIPAHAWVTGLAALWLDGLARAPEAIDLVVKRGAHRTEPSPGSPPLEYHSGPLTWLDPMKVEPRRATVTRACLDALAHSPAATAMPATASAITKGLTDLGRLRTAADALGNRTAHHARVARLLDALATV